MKKGAAFQTTATTGGYSWLRTVSPVALIAVAVTACPGSEASAQDFTGSQTTNGPFVSGFQYFYDNSAFNANAAYAASGNGVQVFYDNSRLNASAGNAVTGELQIFYNASALNASIANAVAGGRQTFRDNSALNASAGNAVSEGTQIFVESSALNASAGNAVSGGAQWFDNSGALNASFANAVSGGTQAFSGGSMLNASAANAVSGGTQTFSSGSVLNATAANAINGGTQNYYDHSTLIAGHATAGVIDALGAGAVTLNDSATLNATVTGTLSNTLTFAAGSSATVSASTGQTLTLNGGINLAAATAHFGSATNAGTVVFNGAPGYLVALSSSIAVDGGTLRLGTLGGFYTANAYGGTTVASGATLDINGDATVQLLSGAGTVTNNSGAAATLTANNDSDSTFSGGIQNGTGTLALTKTGAGTLTLTGASSFSGNTTVNGGTLAIQSGGKVANHYGYIGNSGSTGTVTVDGAGSSWTNDYHLSVGNSGNGTLTIQNGGKVSNYYGYLGHNAGSTGTATVDGNGSTWTNSGGLVVGFGGNGTLNITNGGKVTNVLGYVGFGRNSTSTATVDGAGSSWANSGDLIVGFGGNGTLNITNGGSVSAANVDIAFYQHATGTLNIGAGIGDPAAAPGTLNTPVVVFGQGTGQIVFNHTAADYVFAPKISGAGVVTVEAGTTTLTGAGSSVGAVTVSGGMLEFGQSGTFTAASYTTQSGAVTAIDGTAQLIVTGAFTQSAGSTLNVAIGANDPAITANSASLAGMLNVSGYTGTQYTVIQTTNGITGDFANVNIGGASSPVDYLTVTAGKSADSLAYNVGLALTWNAGPAQGNGVFTLTNGADAFNVGVALTNQTGPFASGWDGRSLTKNGAGTLTLSAMNTYTGATTINGGTLAIAATGGITSDVANYATFQNAGTVAGGVTNNAGATFIQTGGSVAGGVTNAGTVNANGGVLNGAIANNAGGVFNVGGVVTGDGAFGNAGGATLAVAGTGSYTLAGLLTNGGAVTVAVGGALTANGGILNIASGVITNNGTVTDDLNNAGLVTNNGTYNAIVASNTGTITNNGTWNGNVSSSSGTIDNAGTWNGTIVSSGTFTNSGTVSNGLTNSGSATISGGAINGIIVNGGTFTVTGAATANGTFSNSGTFALTGGDFTGLASFTNSGLVTAANGGTLGTASFVNAAGGVIDLRNGSATNVLNMAGNVTFSSGSIYNVDVNGAGQSDRIAATGTATLNGGTVQVTNAPGTYTLGTRYAIVTAGGGVSGQFSDLTQSSPLATPFLAFGLSYDPNTAWLDVTRSAVTFASAGQTRNQIATGGGLDSAPLSSSLVNAVAQLDMASAGRTFDQLSGEVHASAKTEMIEDSRFIRNAVNDRLRAAFDGVGVAAMPVMAYADGGPRYAPATVDSFAVWGQAFGSWGHWNSDDNAARLNRSIGGFFIGADAPVFDTWRFGAVAGYSRTSFNARDRASSGSSDNYHVGLYGGTTWGDLAFRTGAAYTWHDISTGRSVFFPGFGDSLKGDYRAGTAQVFEELAYGFQTGGARLEPFANLAYVNLHTDGFSERGGAAALTGAASNTDATFTTLGLRASTTFDLGGASLTAKGMIGWRHAFGDATPLSTMRFAGSDTFIVAGVPVARNAAVFEAGLDYAITPNATLGVSYNGQLGSGVTDQSVWANFNVRF